MVVLRGDRPGTLTSSTMVRGLSPNVVPNNHGPQPVPDQRERQNPQNAPAPAVIAEGTIPRTYWLTVLAWSCTTCADAPKLVCTLRQSMIVTPSFSSTTAISAIAPATSSVSFSNCREHHPKKKPTTNENPKRNVAGADASISRCPRAAESGPLEKSPLVDVGKPPDVSESSGRVVAA